MLITREDGAVYTAMATITGVVKLYMLLYELWHMARFREGKRGLKMVQQEELSKYLTSDMTMQQTRII